MLPPSQRSVGVKCFGRELGTGRVAAEEFSPKGLRIKSAVGNGHTAGELFHQRFHGPEIVPVPCDQIQSYGTTQTIDYHSQLRVRASLGFTNGLSPGATGGVRGILMNLDMRAVHATHHSTGLGRE